jgi:Na+/phosphate symporter
LARLTVNRLAGVVTGAVATAVLDSSSATTVLVVGLVDAGLLEFGLTNTGFSCSSGLILAVSI